MSFHHCYRRRKYKQTLWKPYIISLVYRFQALNPNSVEYLRLINCYGKAKKRISRHSETWLDINCLLVSQYETLSYLHAEIFEISSLKFWIFEYLKFEYWSFEFKHKIEFNAQRMLVDHWLNFLKFFLYQWVASNTIHWFYNTISYAWKKKFR